MIVLKFIANLLGWLLTLVFQIVAAYLFVFLFSIAFAGLDTTSRAGWLASLLGIWLGFFIGINLIGLVALHWVWKDLPLLTIQRLIGCAIGALIPLLILLPIGYRVPVGDTGTTFYDQVTNLWQPILAQASLFTGVLGFYVPALFKANRLPPKLK